MAVDESKIYETDLTNLSLDECLVIGSTGKVISYVSPKYYIEEGILATPVIFQLSCQLLGLERENDWHKLRSKGICSEVRTTLIADTYSIPHIY